jgi:tetratricopeptide (TPR) repeat protein
MDERALRLFELALDLPEAQRDTFVATAAGDDAALREDVLVLLRAHAESAGLLDRSAVPASIGRWRVLGRLGAGGMGEVFLVERGDGEYAQRAALKLTALGIGGAMALARFHAERSFLARIEHPNIARIIDGGNASDGRPFVVMEYVDGAPVDEWCAARRLGVRERVGLYLQVLSAVDAAHRALVLHRDIKPANVMVTSDGQVKLLDFGIAKNLAGDRGLTLTGLAPLTPEFASPEQLAGEALTTASDIYSLGLLLHLLLAGRLPFGQGGRTTAQALEAMRGRPPGRPSAGLDAGKLALSAREARLWRNALAGDLDRVLLKALASEPRRRYASAAEFAQDLENWLALRPVRARRGDALYRARMFARRHRLAVASATAAMLALAIGLGVAAHQAWQTRQQAARAESARAFLIELITDANPVASGREPSLKEALDQALARIPRHFHDQPESEADIRLGIAVAYTNLMQLDAAEEQIERVLSLREPGTTGHADALQSRALLHWSRGRTDAAEADYLAALSVFASDSGSARKVGEVYNDLASLMSDVGRYEEARRFASKAVANARGLGLDPGALGARLENLGSAEQGLGRLDEAERAYHEAIGLLERALPERTVALAVALNNFALVQRDRGRDDDALALFRRAAAVRERAFGQDHAELAGPLINIARLEAARGEISDARIHADRAVKLAEAAFAPDYVGRGHVHLGAAQVALASGDPSAAVYHAEQALAVFARADAADPTWSERARGLIARARATASIGGDATSDAGSAP